MPTADVLYEEAQARKKAQAQQAGYPDLVALQRAAYAGVPPQTPIFGTQPLPQPELPPYYLAAPGVPSQPPPGPLPGEDAQLAREQALNEEAARATPDVLARATVEPLPAETRLMPLEQEQAAATRMLELAGQVREVVSAPARARAQPQIGLGERLEKGIPGTVQGEVPPLTQVATQYPKAFKFGPDWETKLLAAGITVGAVGVGLETLAAAPAALTLNPLLSLLYFSAESQMEQMNWIPGQPINRLTAKGAAPFRVGLEKAGVPKPVAAPVGELTLWLLASVAGAKIGSKLLESVRGLSAEDLSAAAAKLRPGILAPEETAQAMGREVPVPKDMAQAVLQAVKRKGPEVTPPEVGGIDLVGDFLKRQGTPKEPVFGAIHDMAVTPAPKWMEDPYINFMERFTRPTELDLPAPLTPLGNVERRMATMGDYYEQVASRSQRVTEAKIRLQEVRDAYTSEAPRRRLTRGAQQYGIEAPTEPLISKNAIVKAQRDVRVAKRESRQAINALNEADVRRAGDDIVEEARAMGADETQATAVRVAFENAARIEKLDEPFLNLPPWRKRLIAAGAHLPPEPFAAGYVPGKVGQLWENAGNLRVALSETRKPIYERLNTLQERMEQEIPTLKFVGQEKYAPLVDKYGSYYLYLHPEDFRGISPELCQMMDEMDQSMYSRYAMLQAIDPKAAPPLKIGERYLPRLWQDNIDFLESIRRPSGRPGVEKPRTIANWREVALSDSWPKELSDMSPAELLEYSTRAVDEAISHRLFRKSVLDVYGTKLKPKASAGLVKLQNPLFAGWWAPPDIRWQVDALFEPGPGWIRTFGKFAAPVRNLTFGLDTGLAGYNEVQALATGHIVQVLGGVNRMLNLLGAGVDVWSKRDVSRRIFFELHGLGQPLAEAPFRKGQGTLLKWIPGLNRIDPYLSGAIDRWTGIQYGLILGNTRDLTAEGGLVISKLLGQNLDDPKVIGGWMDFANAVTGTSRGAQRMGTAEIQNTLLTSSRITRSQFAMVGQLANVIRPGATATQRITAVVAITNLAFTLGLAGWAINKAWGDDAEYNPLPWTLEDGKLKRNPIWATVAISGRRYSLIPQKSLMTTMWKVGEALMGLDPDALGRAVSQYGYTRLTPGTQPIPLIFGFGYLPNSGFWAGSIPTRERFKALGLPFLPILAQVAATGQEHGFRGFAEQFFGLNSYELSPSEKEKMFLDKIAPTLGKDDQEAIAAGVVPNSVRQMPQWQAMENERQQDMLNNPRTQQYAELKQTRDEHIAAAGQTYLENKDGYAYRMAVGSARDIFMAATSTMEFADKGTIAEYLSATYDKAVDSLTGELDPEELDHLIAQWEKTATTQQFAAVRTWERASNDPLEAEYRTDRQRIEDSGWWGLKDTTWQQVRPKEYQGFATYRDYQTYLRQQLLPQIPENLDPGMRIALLEVGVRADLVVQAMDVASSAVNRAWLDANPTILSLLLKWGYKIPGKNDIEALIGASE
jgi:hypothetical protein